MTLLTYFNQTGVNPLRLSCGVCTFRSADGRIELLGDTVEFSNYQWKKLLICYFYFHQCCWSEILKKNSKRYQDPVLWEWLEIFFYLLILKSTHYLLMTSTPVLSTWRCPLLERKAWFLSLFLVTDISLKLIFFNLLSPYILCYCLFSYLTVTVRVNIKFFLTKHVISLIAQFVAI